MRPEEKKEILQTHKWIKVMSYKINEQLSWKNHHLAESNFLIQKAKELITQIQ